MPVSTFSSLGPLGTPQVLLVTKRKVSLVFLEDRAFIDHSLDFWLAMGNKTFFLFFCFVLKNKFPRSTKVFYLFEKLSGRIISQSILNCIVNVHIALQKYL